MSLPPELTDAGKRFLLDERTRRSLPNFHETGFSILHGGKKIKPGPHVDAMAHVLEQLANGSIKRLLITLPPRHGKSELASGSLPAWILGHDPTAKVTIASYGLDLAVPLAAKARTIIKNPEYQRLFPGTEISRQLDRAELLRTTKGGEIRAASKGSAMTGLGTHFLIVDDFHKATDAHSPIERENAVETFRNTFLNRFDDLADGRIVIVMQRLHQDDLVGWALRTGKWHHLNLPAYAEQDEEIPLPRGKIWCRKKGEVLAPQIASAEWFEEQRELGGERNFAAQYQQNPGSGGSGLIDWNWFSQYDERPPRNFFHRIVQSIDPAITERLHSDFSAGQTWGYRDGDWYLLDVFSAQIAFHKLVDRVKLWHRQWKADALIIEGASIGHSLYDEMRAARLPGELLCPNPRMPKADRLAAVTVQLEKGSFLLPTSAPWLPDLRRDLLGFPDERNDDHVDALVQFVKYTFDNRRRIEAKYVGGRRERVSRPEPRSRYYDGNCPSKDSW